MGYVTFLTTTSIEKARQDVAAPAEPARQRRSIEREPEQHIESPLAMLATSLRYSLARIARWEAGCQYQYIRHRRIIPYS